MLAENLCRVATHVHISKGPAPHLAPTPLLRTNRLGAPSPLVSLPPFRGTGCPFIFLISRRHEPVYDGPPCAVRGIAGQSGAVGQLRSIRLEFVGWSDERGG